MKHNDKDSVGSTELEWSCLGNREAIRLGAVFIAHCHLLDDLVDKDEPTPDTRIIESEIRWFIEVSSNSFFQRHKLMLMPLVVQGFNAWLDANRMEQSTDENVARAADVVKSFYHEFLYQIAFLCAAEAGKDAWAHLREVTTKIRRYDYDFAAKLRALKEAA
jgi:hypothetical protein